MSLLEIPPFGTELLFILIPVFTIGLSFLVIRMADEDAPSRIRRFFARIVKPAQFGATDNETLMQLPKTERKSYLKDQLLSRIAIFYLLVGVFLAANIISTFYHLSTSLSIYFDQIGSGNTWSSIVLDTVFTGGWKGDFSWYGSGGNPPSGNVTLHDPWTFYYFLIPLADSPLFFTVVFTFMIIFPIAIGVVFLIPLLHRYFREAFAPSMFMYTTGMLTVTSGIFRGFAEAYALEFGSKMIQFGMVIESAADFQGVSMTAIMILFPIILVLFFVFAGMGWKIASTHFPDSKTSQRLLILYIASTYWLSLLSTLVFAWS
ncbi:MAG: hypothetical protein ACXABY_27370 [Candidatus Thorarchaeota archaeon]|jgi:hypothetical protein